MQTADRAARVLELLRLRYPTRETHLVAQNAWELLVATVLAAQCTDVRVNQVTPGLFSRWPGPAELARATQEELEEVIHSTGFYRNKATNLLGAARRVTEVHGGEVPRTMAELVQLPGVARKTANVVLWGAYGINEGIAVDTHVKRIAFRMGFTESVDPVQIERDLMDIFPRDAWGDVNHMLVWFGRHVCDARAPRCGECEMIEVCPRHGVGQKDGAAPRKTAGRAPVKAVGKAAGKAGTAGTAKAAPSNSASRSSATSPAKPRNGGKP
ncbi:endonuclease III [Nitratidesulfovibrio liaohensis]|uniref:endonuclease III n=1 Tax=Nitratidesulfovibrio liaohensis TaxID=2604158 RepID=UPI00142081E6|nr:endonuclease III [Nitratidesulfovibrio liaohensis]NHZ45899.1 endonuclease III [Nitratidesulfovibrio liaohensis]